MNRGSWAALLVVGALAGCASGEGGAANPNLLAPKVVVHQRPDGNVTLFVHGAFREQLYDWVATRVDNETLANTTWAFSQEKVVERPGFFVEVEAQAGAVLYRTRARVDVDAEAERARVAFLTEEGWGDARAYGLPFEHILDRPKVSG